MSVRRLISVIACLALTACSLVAQAPLPRKSPEFSIDQSSGEQILLSSLKGKVVVMEFMFVGSAHCLHIAEMLNKLQSDLGSRGFQAIAVAFGPHADQAMVGHVAERLQLTYPLGYAKSESVDAYLGRQGTEKLKIPQLIVIDRKGMIRSATGTANPTLEDETLLRVVLEPLLKESPPSGNAAHSAPARHVPCERPGIRSRLVDFRRIHGEPTVGAASHQHLAVRKNSSGIEVATRIDYNHEHSRIPTRQPPCFRLYASRSPVSLPCGSAFRLFHGAAVPGF